MPNRFPPDLKVFILCGGRGERLKPLTNEKPKPLIEIKGKPILHYLTTYFENYGLNRFVIAVGYKSEQIADYFQTRHPNSKIEIVDSGDADIITRLRDAAPYFKGDFIMCYGDTLADVDLGGLIDFHRRHKGLISMATYPLQCQFGVLDIAPNGLVESFREKPVLDKWINIGYYYCSREMTKQLTGHAGFVDFLQRMVKDSALYGFRHRGLHITVNTIKELNEAETHISAFEQVSQVSFKSGAAA